MEMFRYLIRFFEEKDKRTWRKLVVFSFISPVMDIFSFSAIIYIMNAIVREKRATTEMTIFALSMGIVSILVGFFELYKCKIRNWLEYDGAHELSVKMCELFIKEDLAHHNQKSVVQVLSMVRSDTQNCIEIVMDGMRLWTNGVTLAGCFLALIYMSGWAGIVSCMVLVIFMAGIFFGYRTQIKVYGEKCRKKMIKTNAQVSIAYGIFKEMKLSHSSETVLDRYQKASSEYAEMQKEFNYRNSIISMIMQNMVMSFLFILLAFLMWAREDELIRVLVTMVVYITLFIRVIPMAYSIVAGMNNIEFKKKSFETLKENMERYKEIKETEKTASQIRQKEISIKKGIQVRNLSFQYNDQAEIFQDASIDIPAGKSIAIIGASGAGKTTFLDLLLGLLKPQSGSILYDDYDIMTQTDAEGPCQADLGAVISYIPQIVYLNGETIRNNVAFYDNEDEVDDEKVVECLKYAQIWEDIARMPEGIDTLIGENGTAISGGQRQRIALARALYKEFELLVMDEATAALDMETEKAVIDSIWKIKGNKTLLIATHHMSLADACDSIYRIENRKIMKIR